MHTFVNRRTRSLLLVGVALASSCVTAEKSVSPTPAPFTPEGHMVISQVYGGGGNSGATYKNDFVELYNNSNAVVTLTGWSVQYASAAGTTWQTTALTGTLQPGQYYLVQEAVGAGGTVSLPAPDATGIIAMSATAGKVALVSNLSALSGACPVAIEDLVSYGTTADNSCEGTAAPTLTNTTAVLRAQNGTTDTNDNGVDFAVVAPSPRNTSSPLTPPVRPVVVAGPVATVLVSPNPGAAKVGQTLVMAAVGKNLNSQTFPTTFTWSSLDPAIATVNASTGVVTGVAVGTTTIRATSANNIVGTATVNVTLSVGNVTVSAGGPNPVGFQTQVFAGGTDGLGNAITSQTQVTWTSSDATIMSVTSTGVVTAKAVGSARITATSKSDGTFGSTTITVTAPSADATARTGHNTDLGVPTDADPRDDFIITRRQYTLSYNPNRAGPNWVSWNLDATHKGSAARCNCFTADPAVAALGFPAYDTNDWINGGVYSRGHMSPSADWNISDADNAPTYYLSNMLPQNQTLNGGAWGDLENYLRTLAVGNTEIYIISGPIYTKNRTAPGVDGLGFLNSATQPNKIAVPDSIWKIAIVVPSANDVAQIGSPSDVQVIAANFPNNATGAGSYTPYLTTIEAIQRSTGYNFLSRIPESVQCKLEVRSCVP